MLVQGTARQVVRRIENGRSFVFIYWRHYNLLRLMGLGWICGWMTTWLSVLYHRKVSYSFGHQWKKISLMLMVLASGARGSQLMIRVYEEFFSYEPPDQGVRNSKNLRTPSRKSPKKSQNPKKSPKIPQKSPKIPKKVPKSQEKSQNPKKVPKSPKKSENSEKNPQSPKINPAI